MISDSSLSMTSDVGHRLKKYMTPNLRGAIAVTLTGSLALFGVSTWNLWQLSRNSSSTETETQLTTVSDQLLYYDEVLTMSARMSASTADPKWEKRYRESEPVLISAFEQASALVPEIVESEIAPTDAAREALTNLEAQAFQLVTDGKSQAALELLLSPEYENYRQIYTVGLQSAIVEIEKVIQDLQQQQQARLQNSVNAAGLSMVLLLVSSAVMIGLIRSSLNSQRRAEIALMAAEKSLVDVNNELEQKRQIVAQQTQDLKDQEQNINLEASLMQNDIGHLLDVISDLEAGDFTVEAEVSDRVTGLVSDTLNRLIENLSNTLQTVSSTAQTASHSSALVQNYAENVAVDVTQQAQGVNELLSLTETVWQSSQNAIAKIEETQSILAAVQSSVVQGQGAIEHMSSSIESLQSGSDRMVQKIKTLGEFVSLADQFAQEQNQTAAMTQILALNASLVAAKAAEQRDPERFQVVAREFESIANQVQQLAQQTNMGLESLQQRTTKINGVVADVDRDVQGLNMLVTNFTQDVSASNQAFADVQRKTEQVEVSGQAVESGNQDIAQAANQTRTTLQSIAQQANRTSERMQATLDRSLEMKRIAHALIDSIEVFSLPTPDPNSNASSLDAELDEVLETARGERELAQPRV